jgi:hypothetical protein
MMILHGDCPSGKQVVQPEDIYLVCGWLSERYYQLNMKKHSCHLDEI